MPSTAVTVDDTGVARTLANGLTITMERLPHLHSAAAGVWIKTGSANESPEQAGVSHFLEHLFFKGTATRTTRQIVEAVERTGGQINAYTSRDYTCIYVKTLDSHIATGIEILADVLKNSLFCDLEKERNIVLEEIASVEDVPEEYVHELLAGRLWPGHPLGRPVLGAVETVSALRLEDVRAYYEAWYRPQNIYFSIAGNFDEIAVLDQACREFGALAPGPIRERCSAPSFGCGAEAVVRDIGQNHLCLGFPGPIGTHPRRYVYDVLSNALGGSSMSRLFERVREDEGLAYAIYTFHSSYLVSGMMGVYAAVAPQNVAKTMEVIFCELRRVREQALSEDELSMNREQLKGNMLMALEDTFVRMSRLAKCMMYHGRLIPIQEVIDSVDAVTVQDVQSLAQEVFAANQCTLVTLGPEDGRVVDPISL